MSHRDEYLDGALRALEVSTLDDLLAGLTIQRIAGLAHLPAKHFNEHCGARSSFLAELLRRSIAQLDRDDSIHEEIQRLYRRMANRDPAVIDAIRDAAERNLRASHTTDPTTPGAKVLTSLAMLAAPNDGPVQEALRAFHDQRMKQLEGMYEGVLVALGREPLAELSGGTTSLAIVIAALADGLVLRGRVDPTLDPARVFADAVIPLFLGLTRDVAEPEPDWAARLGSASTSEYADFQTPSAVRALSGSEETYAAVIGALHAHERSGDHHSIDIASLHGHAERRHLDPSAQALALRSEVLRLVGEGWTLRRLTSIRSLRRLAQEEEGLALFEGTCEHPAVEVRVLVGESLPLFAPIIVGRRVAVLGLEDPQEFGAGSGLELSGRAADVCAGYFDDLWNNERCIRLRTLAGTKAEGIKTVRQAIAALGPVESAG